MTTSLIGVLGDIRHSHWPNKGSESLYQVTLEGIMIEYDIAISTLTLAGFYIGMRFI